MNGLRATPDGYFIEDPVTAARDLLEMLRTAEAADILLLNREGQRELIATLRRLLDDERLRA